MAIRCRPRRHSSSGPAERGRRKPSFIHSGTEQRHVPPPELVQDHKRLHWTRPRSMRPVDQFFFLICDATVLFILRAEQTAAHYALIGSETYLHGFMNSEMGQKNFTDRLERLYLVWNERHLWTITDNKEPFFEEQLLLWCQTMR
jgi:hypothetical protein